MRILLVNYRYFISGGPEKYMFNIKRLLEENGHEVIPFSVHSNKNVETEYSKYFVEPIGGRDATYFEEVKKTPRSVLQMISRSCYSFEVEKAIQKEIDDVQPDLVYILHYVNKLSPSVIRGAKKKGLPVVVRLSDYFLLCPRFDFMYQRKICEDCMEKGYVSCLKKKCVKDSLFASMIRVFSMKLHELMKIYDDVDAFITPSLFLKGKLVQGGFQEDKIYCIPTFASQVKEEQVQNVGTYGLYFGRIAEEKGVETVVKAYEKLPSYQVKIVGDDTTEEAIRLKQYVADKGLTNIQFLGFKSGEELQTVIRDARFTMIPSLWYDNLPNTALESFQNAKPVIASKMGSLPELVKDGWNGFLIDPYNPDDLIEKILCLDDDETVRIFGINSQLQLEQKFSAQKHYHLLMELFERVTKK